MADPVEKDVKSWVDASQYDLETAKSLLKSRRYLYVLFMCQQAVEKILKACATVKIGKFPPRIHNLARPGELAGRRAGAPSRGLGLEAVALPGSKIAGLRPSKRSGAELASAMGVDSVATASLMDVSNAAARMGVPMMPAEGRPMAESVLRVKAPPSG